MFLELVFETGRKRRHLHHRQSHPSSNSQQWKCRWKQNYQWGTSGVKISTPTTTTRGGSLLVRCSPLLVKWLFFMWPIIGEVQHLIIGEVTQYWWSTAAITGEVAIFYWFITKEWCSNYTLENRCYSKNITLYVKVAAITGRVAHNLWCCPNWKSGSMIIWVGR